MADALITRYRPEAFDQVIGQEAAVRALQQACEKRSTHAFLFTGPSGTGKTTLARITAHTLGARDQDITEVDTAIYTGVGDMRALTETMRFMPLGASDIRCVILNECHRASAQAWDSLLMMVEEPPEHVFWFFSTTEPGKVPKAIVTRCMNLSLRPVPWEKLLTELVAPVAEAEGIKLSRDILGMCAREAMGSPRQALSNLAVVTGATDKVEAASLLRTAQESVPVIALARALLDGTSWEKATEILNALKDESAESIRHVVRDYITKVRLNAKTEKAAQRCAAILDAFSIPCHPGDGITPIVLAVDQLVLRRG